MSVDTGGCRSEIDGSCCFATLDRSAGTSQTVTLIGSPANNLYLLSKDQKERCEHVNAR